MTFFMAALFLVLLALLALSLQKTYFYLPYKELKRQAAAHDPLARTLFRAAAYGAELKLLLWLALGVSAAGGFVLFARVAPPPLGFVVVALTLWLAFAWLPRTRLSRLGAQLAVYCTPALVCCLRVLHPLMEYIALYVGQLPVGPHTGLYEREDLYDLLEQQKRQSDSRIGQHDLKLMRQVLQFGDCTAGSIMVPRRKVKALNAAEHLGPVLLDELHKSSHSHFPVYEGKATNIVGILALSAVADAREHGAAQEHASQRVAYVHEADSLAAVVRTFYDSGQQLLVVVNDHDEYTGVVALRDVLQRLIGIAEQERLVYDDRTIVAARYRKRAAPADAPEESSQNSSEMVE